MQGVRIFNLDLQRYLGRDDEQEMSFYGCAVHEVYAVDVIEVGSTCSCENGLDDDPTKNIVGGGPFPSRN